MNRRSFLKFLPAGVLGSKRAAAEMVAEAEAMALARSSNIVSVPSAPPSDVGTWARKAMHRLLDPRCLARMKEEQEVTRLDPDLVASCSYSLAVKILIQKDRNFERRLASEKTYLQGIMDGWLS